MARGKIESDEVCPVCKSSRYLNPNMKFMIEPSCYHKMCESCVDRIFSSGPAACPVAGCGKTLRKARFKHPNFEDLAVEREVDIRAKVERILNRRESDFETLQDFNAYLEQKEDLIWNLVKSIDVEATEKKLAAYAKENKGAIARNKAMDDADAASVRADEQRRADQSELAREEMLRDLEEDRADREAGRRQIVDGLAHGRLGDAHKIVRTEERDARKQSSLKRAAVERAREQAAAASAAAAGLAGSPFDADSASTGAAGSLGFRGLKKAEAPKVELPYSPFAGVHIETQYYGLQDSYEHNWSSRVKTDPTFVAGGYEARDYYSRAQVDAHAGLGVFLAVELSGKTPVATA